MKKSVFVFVFMFLASQMVIGQDQPVKTGKAQRREKAQRTAAEIKELITSRSFDFQVNQALPMGGGAIYLTSQYDLKIKGDSAFAWLPYYGVAYRADYGSSEGGIKFREPVKDYKLVLKKSGYEITFSVHTVQDNYNLHLEISETGYGTLGVTSINRQFISFSGRMETKKE